MPFTLEPLLSVPCRGSEQLAGPPVSPSEEGPSRPEALTEPPMPKNWLAVMELNFNFAILSGVYL